MSILDHNKHWLENRYYTNPFCIFSVTAQIEIVLGKTEKFDALMNANKGSVKASSNTQDENP